MEKFDKLPDDCISEIISFTSPVDASVFSVISKRFKVLSESDIVWNKFLRSDIQHIISRSTSILVFPTKRELYLSLSDSPILLDGGKLSFSLDKKTGKKCFMVSAAELTFTGLNQTSSFIRVPEDVSRFPEVAVLYLNSELSGIFGKLSSQMLSEETLYSAYLVYTMWPSSEDRVPPVIVVSRFVDNEGREVARGRASRIFLDPRGRSYDPRRRPDGWLEVEIGTFFNVGRNPGAVELQVFSVRRFPTDLEINVQGIEFRPDVVGAEEYCDFQA